MIRKFKKIFASLLPLYAWKSFWINFALIIQTLFDLYLFHLYLGPWFSGYHYCTTPFNKNWTHVLNKFNSCLLCVRDLSWWESLAMVLFGNRAKYIFLINQSANAIHRFIFISVVCIILVFFITSWHMVRIFIFMSKMIARKTLNSR